MSECFLALIPKREKEIMRAKNFWLEEIDSISKINEVIPARNLGKSHLLSHPPTSYLTPGFIATTSKVLGNWHLSLTRISPQSSSWAFVYLNWALVCRALFQKQKFDRTTTSIFQWLPCLQGKV